MQNEYSMHIKPIHQIERKCKTIRRIHEIIMTMPDPVIAVYRYYNNIVIAAINRHGICLYRYHGPCIGESDIALSLEIDILI